MDEVVILELGAEAGGLTLHGRKAINGQWEFRSESAESSWSMLDEEEGTPTLHTDKEPVWVRSWAEAVALLDRNR
jgi:hypothetical protein